MDFVVHWPSLKKVRVCQWCFAHPFSHAEHGEEPSQPGCIHFALFQLALRSSKPDFVHMKMWQLLLQCVSGSTVDCIYRLFTSRSSPAAVYSFLSLHLRLYSWLTVEIHHDRINEWSLTDKVTANFWQLAAASRQIQCLSNMWTEDVINPPPRRFWWKQKPACPSSPGQIRCHSSTLTASQTEAPSAASRLIHQPPLLPPQHGALMPSPAELYFIRQHQHRRWNVASLCESWYTAKPKWGENEPQC